MRAEELCDIFGDIDDRYIEEALTTKGSKTKIWVRYAVAACFVALVAIPIALKMTTARERKYLQELDDPSNFETPIGEEDSPSQDQPHGVVISLGDIPLNQLGPDLDAARAWRDPELYHREVWDEGRIEEYYGRNLTPEYVPEGLLPSAGNGKASFIIENADGTVIEDTVYLGFYHGYYEDGSPKFTDDVNAIKGISITVSRLGILNCCVYTLPDDELETANISGTSVTFAYRQMKYGPYDPETKEPSGYYDLYTAEFTLEGAEYEIVSHQMPLEEIVKVTASIITGNSHIEVTG